VITNAGHFPHKDHPQRFVNIVNDFIRATEPATYHRGRWRALLRAGHPAPGPVAASPDLRAVPDIA
jgi:hypothetical protein